MHNRVVCKERCGVHCWAEGGAAFTTGGASNWPKRPIALMWHV
jgi:hypothetical protein